MLPGECLRLLELAEPASIEQIKQAYRRLAQRLHPDKHQDDASARLRFVAISDAYRTLMQAARAMDRGAKVGTCVRCGEFGEAVTGLDGLSRCPRCIFHPEGGRLLPMPALRVATCFGAIILIAASMTCSVAAMNTAVPARVPFFASAALVTGAFSLISLAYTAISIVYCITPRERELQADFARSERTAKAVLDRRRKRRHEC